jgi:hypothetical protein
MKRVQSGVLAGISAVALATVAQASFIPVFTSASAGPGANTTFSYDLVFTAGNPANERLDATPNPLGDFITIYDIAGFVSATPPANFLVSVQNLGLNGFATAATDNPALPNVTFLYNGVGPIAADTTFTGGSIVSLFSGSTTGLFSSEVTRNGGQFDGTPIGQAGGTVVPIPEPGALLFLGALPLALLRRR